MMVASEMMALRKAVKMAIARRRAINKIAAWKMIALWRTTVTMHMVKVWKKEATRRTIKTVAG